MKAVSTERHNAQGWCGNRRGTIQPIGETKRSLAVESHGLPPGIVIDGANRHDIKLLERALCSIVIAHPEGANLCLDAGYGGAHDLAVEPGYAPPIRSRGEERQEKAANPSFKARRRVVEVCHSRLNRFRKLLVRYEKKGSTHLALLQFACAVIVWRHLILVHPGFIPG